MGKNSVRIFARFLITYGLNIMKKEERKFNGHVTICADINYVLLLKQENDEQ